MAVVESQKNTSIKILPLSIKTQPKQLALPTQKCSYFAAYFFPFLDGLTEAFSSLAHRSITVVTACTKYALYLSGLYHYQPPTGISEIEQLTRNQQNALAYDPRFDWKALPEKVQEAYINTLPSTLLTPLVKKGFFPHSSLSEKVENLFISKLEKHPLNLLVTKGFSPKNQANMEALVAKLRVVNYPFNALLPHTYFPQKEKEIDQLTNQELKSLLYGYDCPHKQGNIAISKWNNLAEESQRAYLKKMGTDQTTLDLLVAGFKPKGKAKTHFIQLIERIRNFHTQMCEGQEKEIDRALNKLNASSKSPLTKKATNQPTLSEKKKLRDAHSLSKPYFPQTEEKIHKLKSWELDCLLYESEHLREPSNIRIEKWNNLPEKSQLAYLHKMRVSQKVLDLLFAGFKPKGIAKTHFIQLIEKILNQHAWLCDNQEEEIDDALNELKSSGLPSKEEAISPLILSEVQALLYGATENRDYRSINISLWNDLCGEVQLAYLKKLGAGEDVKNLIRAGFYPRQEARQTLSDYAKILNCPLSFDLESTEVKDSDVRPLHIDEWAAMLAKSDRV